MRDSAIRKKEGSSANRADKNSEECEDFFFFFK